MTTTSWHRIQTSTAAFGISSGRLVFGHHKSRTVLSLLWWALGTAERNESLTFPDDQSPSGRGQAQMALQRPSHLAETETLEPWQGSSSRKSAPVHSGFFHPIAFPSRSLALETNVALAFAGVGSWHFDDRNLCNQRHLACPLFQRIRTESDAHCQQRKHHCARPRCSHGRLARRWIRMQQEFVATA